MTQDKRLQQLYGAAGGALSWARNPEAKRADSLKGAQTGVTRHYAGSTKAWSLAMHAAKRKRKLEQAAAARLRPVDQRKGIFDDRLP